MRTKTLGLILLGLIVVGWLIPRPDVTAETPQRDSNACDRLVTDLTALGTTYDLLDFYAHQVGCALDEGRVYVPDLDNGCMRTAFLLFATGADVADIPELVIGSGECVQYEDGTFAPGTP
jgi:hypothetical protein